VELARDQSAHEKKATLYQSDIDGWSRELAALAQDLARAKKSNVEQSRHLDGLMKRIHISHEIGGFVPWAILLLLLAVETGPIFFKMMLVTSTYDYLLENAKRLATARAGVEVDAQVLITETNEEVHVDRFHQVEARVAEERRRVASETEVAEAVHRRFRAATSREIEEGDGYKKYVDEG
jgi:hypothetical protein